LASIGAGIGALLHPVHGQWFGEYFLALSWVISSQKYIFYCLCRNTRIRPVSISTKQHQLTVSLYFLQVVPWEMWQVLLLL
jgi:hypothetical protein